MLSHNAICSAKETRRFRPTAEDQKNNPGIDLDAVYRDDIEHAIKCLELDAEQAVEFRALCGL